MLIIAVLLGVVIFLGIRAGLVFIRKNNYADYWHRSLSTTSPGDVLRLVALGDSISQGVGASKVDRGLIGHVARYIHEQTGREVAVKNYSRSGATAEDVATRQLPLADFDSADIVLLEIGANDTRRLSPEEYERFLVHIIDHLPLEKTIIADVPFVGNRDAYQAALDEVLEGRTAIRAHFIPELLQSSTWTITAGDFFHPNDKGYELWFRSFRPGLDTVLAERSLLKEVQK